MHTHTHIHLATYTHTHRHANIHLPVDREILTSYMQVEAFVK